LEGKGGVLFCNGICATQRVTRPQSANNKVREEKNKLMSKK
jgi:hypothetical protein